MKRLKATFSVLMILTMSISLSAQVTFITRADRDIIEGEPFEVQYILQGAKQFSQFNIPPMSDFQLVEVYDLPSGQKYNDVLQKIEEVLTRVAVLKPIHKGAAWIPGATVEVNGKSISSNRVRVRIESSDSQPQPENEVEDASVLLPGDNIDKKVEKNFFLTAAITKSTCYVGEPLMAVYKACSRLNARSQVSKRPSFTGFSVIEMVDGYDSEPSVEKVNGENFFVHLVRKVQLFPLQAGKYEIDNAQVESVIQFVKERENAASISGPGEVLRHAVTVSSKTLPVEVLPLPEAGQPQNFSGAVGNYVVDASSDKHKIESGDVIRYKFTIRGKGNFPLITPPDLSFPDGVYKGEVKVTDELNPYNFPLSGSKTFEYELNIKRAGLITIPSISFSFFDPADKSYHTVQSNPVDVIVEQPATRKLLPVVNAANEPSLPRHYYFLTFIAVAILAWVSYQLIRSNAKKQVPVVEPEIEEPVVTDPFKSADDLYQSGDYRNFLLEVQRLIYHGSAHRYNIPASAQNRGQIRGALLNAGADADQTAGIYDLLSACEWQLYTPSMDLEEVERIRSNARTILHSLNGE